MSNREGRAPARRCQPPHSAVMPCPADSAAMLVDSIISGEPMPDDALIKLVRAQKTPVRMKMLADNLLCYGAITTDQRGLLTYLFPEISGA